MRVALINNYPGPTIGGGEVLLLALAKGFLSRGVEVVVVCAADSGLESRLRAMGGVKTVPVSFSSRALLTLPASLARLLGNVDVVQGTGLLTNVIARNLGDRLGVPAVNAVQVVPGSEKFEREGRVKAAGRALLERHRRRSVARFVVPSLAVADRLHARGVAGEAITVIPNGLDIESLRAAGAEALDMQLPPGHPRIGYIGRLARIKGCEYLIGAVAQIARSYPDASFLVAGAGTQESELRALASRLGVSDRVAFLGFVDRVPAFMRSLDLLVVPSLSEAFGLSALEAQVLGVPLVATRVGGLEEIVLDGETGVLVSPGHPASIAEGVIRLLSDPDRAKAMSELGARRAEAAYSAEVMVNRYVALYEELAGKVDSTRPR